MEEVIRLVERGKSELEAHAHATTQAHVEAAAGFAVNDPQAQSHLQTQEDTFTDCPTNVAAPPTPPAEPEGLVLDHDHGIEQIDGTVDLQSHQEHSMTDEADDDLRDLDGRGNTEPLLPEQAQRRDSGADNDMEVDDDPSIENDDVDRWDEDVARWARAACMSDWL